MKRDRFVPCRRG